MSSRASCQIIKILGCACAGSAGNVSPPLEVSDPRMHHGTCIMHMPWCILGWLSKGFLWSRWQGKRSWHSRRMCNLKIYVSGKRPMSSLYLYAYYTSFMTIVSSPVTVNPPLPPHPPPPPPSTPPPPPPPQPHPKKKKKNDDTKHIRSFPSVKCFGSGSCSYCTVILYNIVCLGMDVFGGNEYFLIIWNGLMEVTWLFIIYQTK